MDEFRDLVKRMGAVRIGSILSEFDQQEGPSAFQDGQKVLLAGVVSTYKTKTTKNNSLMAYATLEDDSGSMELLVFARVLEECGGYLQPGTPVLVNGRISVRDEKEPQLLCDGVRPLKGMEAGEAQPVRVSAGAIEAKKLYMRLPSQEGRLWEQLPKLLNMFPGTTPVVIVFADTGKRLGTRCLVHDALVRELEEWLGKENVVVQK